VSTSGALQGRRALVTGAASGIGAAIAWELARRGASVVLADRDEAALEAQASAINDEGGTASARLVDLAELAGLGVFADELVAEGAPDIVVNNAADHGERHPLASVPLEEWQRVVATNLLAPAVLSQRLGGAMAEAGGGVIVNLTAIQARLPAPTYVPYVASKGGLLALTRALALELSPRGVRVVAVSPGAIATGSTAGALALSRGGDAIPTLVGRMGSAADVAGVVADVVGEQWAFVTGCEIVVDGGRLLSREPDPMASLAKPPDR